MIICMMLIDILTVYFVDRYTFHRTVTNVQLKA
jgi:hypothetical protein